MKSFGWTFIFIFIFCELSQFGAQAQSVPRVEFTENLKGSVIPNASEFDFEHPSYFSTDEIQALLERHKKTKTASEMTISDLLIVRVERASANSTNYSRAGQILSASQILIQNGPESILSLRIVDGTFNFLSQRTRDEFFSMRYLLHLEDTQNQEKYVLYGFKKIVNDGSFKLLDFFLDTTRLYIAIYKIPKVFDSNLLKSFDLELRAAQRTSLRPQFVGELEISTFNVTRSFLGLSFSNSPSNSAKYFYDFLHFYFSDYKKVSSP